MNEIDLLTHGTKVRQLVHSLVSRATRGSGRVVNRVSDRVFKKAVVASLTNPKADEVSFEFWFCHLAVMELQRVMASPVGLKERRPMAVKP